MRSEKLEVLSSSFEVYSFSNHYIIPFNTVERVGIRIESLEYQMAFYDPSLFLYFLISYIMNSSRLDIFALRYEIITDENRYSSIIKYVELKTVEKFINSVVQFSRIKPDFRNVSDPARNSFFWYFNFLNYSEYTFDTILN